MFSLLIDCSHKIIFIGVFKDTDNWEYQRIFDGLPYEALNDGLIIVFNEMNITVKDIGTIYMPCNPGSKLGIRLTSMLAETLNCIIHRNINIKYYNGLFLTALILKNTIKEREWLITENGRNSWSAIEINSKLYETPIIQSFDSDTINSFNETVYYLPQAKNWDAPLIKFKEVSYEPEKFLQFINFINNSKIDQCILQKSSYSYTKWEKTNN